MNRILQLIEFYIKTVMIFITAKMVFMLANHGYISDIPTVVSHGLSLDLSTSLYLIIIPFLLTLVTLIPQCEGKWYKMIMQIYTIIISYALSLIFIADTSLYPFWGFKLDATAIQFLDTPGDAFASVSIGYVVLRIIIWLFAGFIIALFYHFSLIKHSSSISIRQRLSIAVFLVLCIPCIIIGIRGGTTESTTNIGQVYFSNNQFLNHSAVNPLFSFIASFEKTASDNINYDFLSAQQLQQQMQGLYPTTSIHSESLLNTTRPNIIIVLMESAGTQFAHVMPTLRHLASEGINFTNCYGNTWRTDRGTVCTFSGYPSFPTLSVMKMPNKSRQLPALAQSLKRQGYTNSYLYGGDINFTNMRSYLLGTGFDKLTWMNDYTNSERHSAQWGVRDDITFATLADMVIKMNPDKPQFIGYSTLSSHEPWDVPTHTIPGDKHLNAFNYLDKCIDTFIKKIRNTPAWRNLLIIFLPDHSINYKQYNELHPDRNRIPMIWVGGAVKQHKNIDVICNQTDLAATLLAQLHLPHHDFKYSRDVLSSNYKKPFAIHNFNNGVTIYDDKGYTVYDLNAMRISATNTRQSVTAQQHVIRAKAILQATLADLKAKK